MAQPRFAQHALTVDGTTYAYYRVRDVEGAERLPLSLQVLVENVLRCVADPGAARAQAEAIVSAGLAGRAGDEIEFMPARVLFQDFTGVPVFVDFAAMRDAAAARGGDPRLVNPQIPCTLVVDHSVAADVVSSPCAAAENARIEAERNAERFAFLKWSAGSFDNVGIVPPGAGICHQLNIERFCRVAMPAVNAAGLRALGFDTLVGTDSHTTTANGVGVLGWGVGGIEAEAAALGQPCSMLVPEVVGVRLTGRLSGAASAMDLALTFAERLRPLGVVGKFVEVFGPGATSLTATQRATVANMTPEYGATATFFPADEAVLAQLELSGRTSHELACARAYLEAQGMLGADAAPAGERAFSQVVEIDLDAVAPTLAGPSRPHNRVDVVDLPARFEEVLAAHGHEAHGSFPVSFDGEGFELDHGAIAIAAVTSCTTATDPAMMVAAGLAARRACELGAEPLPWVKKVLAPGSHATTELLRRAGLLEPLARQGFAVCGYGCMSCIGNSGPVFGPMHEISGACELASVLSGNRNFDGRISPDVAQNYLAAPALVIAYALAGTVRRDLAHEPVCEGARGPIYLADLLPSDDEVSAVLERVLTPDLYEGAGEAIMAGDANWRALPAAAGDTFGWDDASTYVRRPSYFEDARPGAAFSLTGARCLAYLGDFVTTDHISPAGAIAPDSPAARYLRDRGIAEADFNTYGSRRGNHEVMMRGTFANVKLENRLAQGRVGGWTSDPRTGEVVSIFDAAESAREAGTPLVVLAGKMYGSGSSRDWAAKGPGLLGVRAVIAESFERIHRSNLVGMGILPLQFREGESAASLGLTGRETFRIDPVDFSAGAPDPAYARVVACGEDGRETAFEARVRVDTATEAAYLRAGGILPFVLDALMD